MRNKIIKFIVYYALAILMLSIFGFIPAYIAKFALCAGCFLTIYGPWVVNSLYIIFAIYLLIKIYSRIFQLRMSENPAIFPIILKTSIVFFILSLVFILGGDYLNIGGPYTQF